MRWATRVERTPPCKVAAERHGEAMAGRAGSPTLMCGKTGRNSWGARQTTQPRVPVGRNKVSKPLTEKNLWGFMWQEKLPVSQESTLERPTVS